MGLSGCAGQAWTDNGAEVHRATGKTGAEARAHCSAPSSSAEGPRIASFVSELLGVSGRSILLGSSRARRARTACSPARPTCCARLPNSCTRRSRDTCGSTTASRGAWACGRGNTPHVSARRRATRSTAAPRALPDAMRTRIEEVFGWNEDRRPAPEAAASGARSRRLGLHLYGGRLQLKVTISAVCTIQQPAKADCYSTRGDVIMSPLVTAARHSSNRCLKISASS
jgi:hypothetical protein